ncbi:hypothetical protein BU16DRAFT_527594 [Lophium mytilinum]|uniref:Uncharacterized protein n=1 Tax=Lophium mytilinum TaxID=390894 RepID=A0A6A6QQS2_9PEZI|nr:hypothetical protein BU16DRAFT_527594 [Lophium mytilinum]
MARLRSDGKVQNSSKVADALPDGASQYSYSNENSDEDRNGESDLEEDGDDDAQIPDSEDLANSQLIAEHSRDAALSEEDITDSVQVAALHHDASHNFSESIVGRPHRSSAQAAANASLLNAARQEPASRRNQPAHDTLPIRPTRSSRNLEPVPPTKAGKLKRPSSAATSSSNPRAQRRRDPYNLPSSQSDPSPANTAPDIQITPQKQRTGRRNRAEPDEAVLEPTPPSRKSKRVAGEDVSVEPAPPGEIVEHAVQKRQGIAEKRRHTADDDAEDQGQTPPKRPLSSRARPAGNPKSPAPEVENTVARGRGRPRGTKNPPKPQPEKSASSRIDQAEKEQGVTKATKALNASNKAILPGEANSKAQQRASRRTGSRNQAGVEQPEENDHSTSGHQEPSDPKPRKTQGKDVQPQSSSTVQDPREVQPGEQRDGIEDEEYTDVEQSDSEEERGDFLGEAPELQKVFSFERRKIPLETDTGKEIRESYLIAQSLFRTPETDHGDELNLLFEERDAELLNLRNLLTTVERDEFPEAKGEIIQDLYARVLPSLALLLEDIWDCCVPKETEGVLPEKCLSLVIPYIRMILSLHSALQTWKEKPDTKLAIVKPVQSQIIAPLKKVLNILEKEKRKRQDAEAQLEQKRATAAALEEREELDSRLEEERRERTALKRKWIDLHLTRMACEPDARLAHRLRAKTRVVLPIDHEPKIEQDADGNPFERVDGLGAPRTSRPPTAGAKIALQWTKEERSALDEALEKYAGKRVYQNVFKKHCGRGGLLRKYTVPEIVEQAMYMRSQYIDWALEQGGQPEEWIESIPVFHWVEEKAV